MRFNRFKTDFGEIKLLFPRGVCIEDNRGEIFYLYQKSCGKRRIMLK